MMISNLTTAVECLLKRVVELHYGVNFGILAEILMDMMNMTAR